MDKELLEMKEWVQKNHELKLLYEHVEAIKQQTRVMEEQISIQNKELKKSKLFNWVAFGINALLLMLNVIAAFMSL